MFLGDCARVHPLFLGLDKTLGGSDETVFDAGHSSGRVARGGRGWCPSFRRWCSWRSPGRWRRRRRRQHLILRWKRRSGALASRRQRCSEVRWRRERSIDPRIRGSHWRRSEPSRAWTLGRHARPTSGGSSARRLHSRGSRDPGPHGLAPVVGAEPRRLPASGRTRPEAEDGRRRLLHGNWPTPDRP